MASTSQPSPCSTTKDNENPNSNPTPTPTPTPTSNFDGQVGSCGTPIQVEEEGDTLVLGKKRKFINEIWQHFDYKAGEIPKAICKYCSKELGGNSRNGTKYLKDHHKICPLKRHRDIISNFTQKKLKIESCGDKQEQVVFFHGFNEEHARRDLANMVIMHEHPLSIVEQYGFRKYSKTLQPSFNMISRNTLKKDILKVYEHEKGRTMKLLASAQSKVAITTDMWTSQNQKCGFMAITAHWIDSVWTLQSRIMRFVYVPCPHTAEVLSEELLNCFSEWNLSRKLSSLTVDNCSSNDAIINILKDRLDLRTLPLKGKFFHMQCCAHILNLIVKDGLEIIDKSIEKIRDSVTFWKATPKREEIFGQVCESLSIAYSKKLKLDCRTRWNSTLLMLQTALLYREVFPKLTKRDKNYKCVPSDEEWDMAGDICARLEVFYDCTMLFSGTKYPTANTYFHMVFDIRHALHEWSLESNLIIKAMAKKMIDKFDKYWSVIHGMMGVACLLDPRYKVIMLECCFSIIYDFDMDEKVEKIKEYCHSLFDEYLEKTNSSRSPSYSTSTTSTVTSNSYACGKRSSVINLLDTKVKEVALNSSKSELDLYLAEPNIPRTEDFDILVYWKASQSKFPILASIARDIYAIPVSTVASESAFSTSGRFISPHRNRLHPKTLEALMCGKDWLLSAVNQEDSAECSSYRRSTFMEDDDDELDEDLGLRK